MGKVILRWIAAIFIVLFVLYLSAVLADDDSGGVLWLIILFLSILVSGSWATSGTVKVYHQNKDAGSGWLDSHGWDKSTSLEYRGWKLYVNNHTQEVAIFNTSNSTKQPDKVLRFGDIRGAGLYQENIKGKSNVRVVIQMIDGKPYAMAVTNRPLSPTSPELQQALAFARRVNELFSMIATGNVAGSASGKIYVIAKCYNCGQLLRGEAGRAGWCPKCDANIRMPDVTTPGVRIDHR